MEVSEEGDPLTAIARYHVMERPSCPRIFGAFPAMAEFLNAMIREFKVDGVISERMQFCDLWGDANVMLTKKFAETKVPLLVMDREYLEQEPGNPNRVHRYLRKGFSGHGRRLQDPLGSEQGRSVYGSATRQMEDYSHSHALCPSLLSKMGKHYTIA